MLNMLLQLQIRPTDDLLLNLTMSPIFTGFVKILFIVAAVLYVAFSFVVVRQITLMRQTVITSLSPLLQVLGYLHMLFAVGVVLLFLLIL